MLTDVTDEELTPVDMFDMNPLNTDAVDAEVDVPNVGVIDGKAKVVVAGSIVVVSGTVAVFFTIVWPPNIGVAANAAEVGEI